MASGRAGLGRVTKNTILLVDYTETLRKRGLDRTAALLRGGPARLRSILMTTLSIMVAPLPIAIGIEAGSELLRAAAVVLIGGLTTSTLLRLFFVPAMCTIFDDIQSAVDRVVQRLPASDTDAVVVMRRNTDQRKASRKSDGSTDCGPWLVNRSIRVWPVSACWRVLR